MLVLFDIGSTLLEGPPQGPGTRLANAFGLQPADHGRVSDLLFKSAYAGPDALAERLAHEFSLPLQNVLDEVRSLWAAQIDEAYPLPGAHRALDIVMAAGHTIAFVSNIWQPFLEAFKRHFPEAFAAYRGYYSFRMGVSKPNTAIFKAALDEIGADPRETVVIGDTYVNDIRPGLNLGMRAIWLLHRPGKEKSDIVRVINGSELRPDVTLEDISQLSVQHLGSIQY